MPTFTASDGTEFSTRSEWRKYEFKLSYTFTDKENEHNLSKQPGAVDGQPFDLTNLKNCTAVILDHTDQVQADEVHDSKIFIGACGESLFVRNCTNSVFYVCCKQLRTRDCVNCTFYLYSISEPIIETSTNMKFACFNGGYPEQATHMEKARLDPAINKWAMIFDFNDEAKTGKNWSLMSSAEPWFPTGAECERAVPLLSATDATSKAVKLAPSENGSSGMMSFSFNTTQEQAEAATVSNESSEPPAPPSNTQVEPQPAESTDISIGTKVEARYGGGTTWYLAIVAAVSADGLYDLDYLDGNKETQVKPEFVQLPKKRVVGWNKNRAKAAAERRKASGTTAPTALGSCPDIVAQTAALEDALKKLTYAQYLTRGIPGVNQRQKKLRK